MSLHKTIQREMLTMGEDLKEFGERVVQEPIHRETNLPVAYPLEPIPDILDFIRYTSKKLQALEEYILENTAPAAR